jgi:hypothetical protein
VRTRVLVGIGIVAAALVAVPGAAAGPSGAADTAPAAICATYADAQFHGPNFVYGLDTSAYERAGWGCELRGLGAGGTWTGEAALRDPRTKRFRQLCTSGGGTFYVFDRVLGPGPEDTVFVILGCMRI